MSSKPEWLDSIYDPGMYPHPVSEIHLMETHISWIILTGDWVYKLKKPVNFGFVDFSTLELRHAACDEELRLNRRTAPLIYDSVVALAEDADCPQFGASGPVIEYAVRLRQFRQEELLEHRLARNELSIEEIDSLACAVADLHRQAAVASVDSRYGSPQSIKSAVEKCLEHLADDALPESLRSQVGPLAEWTRQEWSRLHERFLRRKAEGRVRECHGDLHLGNLVRHQGKPVLFDCLEFNPDLRWIDVMSDLAFLVMDLCDKHAESLAWRVLNRWLEQTGDYDGLSVLRYYGAYRALVRAKVAALRLGQQGLSDTEEKHQHELLESYVQLALQSTKASPSAIVLMHGVSGSGKSFLAKQLVPELGAIQIRSDVERKRLCAKDGKSLPAESTPGTYTAESIQKTYDHLKSLAKIIVANGYPVIVDATFSRQINRKEFEDLARELNVPFVIVSCNAHVDVLQKRITQRQQSKCDPSEADTNVLAQQLATAEPLSDQELEIAICVDTDSSTLPDVVRGLHAKLH